VSLVYKLHVFLGVTLFVLFPFTRLVHIVSAPVWYLGRRYQIVRVKHSGRAVPPVQAPVGYRAPAKAAPVGAPRKAGQPVA